MSILFGIGMFLFFWNMDEQAKADKRKWEAEERRHREVLEALERNRSVTRRRMARDEKGRFIAEEITVPCDVRKVSVPSSPAEEQGGNWFLRLMGREDM